MLCWLSDFQSVGLLPLGVGTSILIIAPQEAWTFFPNSEGLLALDCCLVYVLTLSMLRELSLHLSLVSRNLKLPYPGLMCESFATSSSIHSVKVLFSGTFCFSWWLFEHLIFVTLCPS